MAFSHKLLSITPPGGPADYILDMAPSAASGPFLQFLGYGHVRGCLPGATGEDAEEFSFPVDRFDFERDFYPYPNAHFKTILCCDLLETLAHDPMYLLDEIHRILRPGCDLVFSTRAYTEEQIRALLENCGLEITLLESDFERVYAVARKVGPVRERYPALLYPNK